MTATPSRTGIRRRTGWREAAHMVDDVQGGTNCGRLWAVVSTIRSTDEKAPMTPTTPDALAISITDFCHSINISRRSFYNLVQRGEAPPEDDAGGKSKP